MDQSTLDKLRKLHLKTMAAAYEAQDSVPGIMDMTFDERLSFLVDAEMDSRDNRRLSRRIKEAHFPDSNAVIEGIKYYQDRNLNRNQITALATNQYIHKPKNILVTGATGAGKTYILAALGNRACQQNYKVLYIRMPELFNETERAKMEGEYEKLLKKYHSRDLLIIDDWLLYPVKEGQCEQILEVLEGRYRHSATIVGSQYTEDGWRERLGSGAVAEAIMDRLTACAERIMILGDKSMRTRND